MTDNPFLPRQLDLDKKRATWHRRTAPVKWEELGSATYRLWVPNGWIVRQLGGNAVFVPDDAHVWMPPCLEFTLCGNCGHLLGDHRPEEGCVRPCECKAPTALIPV